MRPAVRDGNAPVFLTLALSLAVPFGGIGLVVAGSVGMILASRFRIARDALKLYASPWVRSDAFALNLLVLVVTLIELGLLLYHHDKTSEFENQLKQYGMALAILLTIRRYSPAVLIWGAAIGCLLACAVAAKDVFLDHLPRAMGPTNSIRFGMIAALFSMYCLVGAAFLRGSGLARLLLVLCGLAGLFAVLASGSRGAVLALPPALLLLVPHLWHRSRRMAMIGAALLVSLSAGLAIWQVNAFRNETIGFREVVAAIVSGKLVEDRSDRNRAEMLLLSARLFKDHPLLGVGTVGWLRAVEAQRKSSEPKNKLGEVFNQPHNQYANDLVKGGLVRGLGGLAMLILPLYCFAIRHPFRPARSSLAPLLGLTTCVTFATFSFTESVMDLSLTSSLYVIVIFYLMAASEGAPLDTPRHGKGREATARPPAEG